MKKGLLLVGILCCTTLAMQAKILRVSNITGSSAPYKTLTEAHNTASVGDTIIIDGSNIEYEPCKITKQLVIMGAGYWLVENNISQVGISTATIKGMTVVAKGVVLAIKGL